MVTIDVPCIALLIAVTLSGEIAFSITEKVLGDVGTIVLLINELFNDVLFRLDCIEFALANTLDKKVLISVVVLLINEL